MSMKLDTHLFGSRTGYQCLAKSAGVSGVEDRLLSEFGFGQSSDDRFLRGLVTSPTAFARPLPGGRIAITRVLAGPLDDGGRPTLERRSILLSAREYLSVRRELGQLLSNSRIWSAKEFSSGQPISVEAPRASSRSAQEGDWLVFDAWVSALDRPPHAVVVGSGDDASDTILSAVACLADEDVLRFSWGVRLLSPIAWVDVVSLSPYGSMDGRRQVFGLSRNGCVNQSVSAARASHPGRLPSLAELRPVEADVPEARGGRRADRAGRRPDARLARSRARTRVLVAVSAISLIMVGVVVGIVLLRGLASRVPGPMLGSGASGSDGLGGVTPPADNSGPATDPAPASAPAPAPQADPPPDPALAPVSESGPPTPPTADPEPIVEPDPAPTPADSAPSSAPAPQPPAPSLPSSNPPEAASEVSEVTLSSGSSAMLEELTKWATQVAERDLEILALYKQYKSHKPPGPGSQAVPNDLSGLVKEWWQVRKPPPQNASDKVKKRRLQTYEDLLVRINRACSDIKQLGDPSNRVSAPKGVMDNGYVRLRLDNLRHHMALPLADSDCGARSDRAFLVLESAVLLGLATKFVWDERFFDAEVPGKIESVAYNSQLEQAEMTAFGLKSVEWLDSPRCQTVLVDRLDALRLLPGAGFQRQTTSLFLRNNVAKLLPKDFVQELGPVERRTVSGYLEKAMKHVIGECPTSEQLRSAWSDVKSFIERIESAVP